MYSVGMNGSLTATISMFENLGSARITRLRGRERRGREFGGDARGQVASCQVEEGRAVRGAAALPESPPELQAIEVHASNDT